MLDEPGRGQEVPVMGDDIRRIPVLRFTPEFYREVGALERRMDRALGRSRRNGKTAKRCAHGRTQRTRRKR